MHEDLLGAYFVSQSPTTPAILDLLTRVDAGYREGVGRYNAFVTGILPGTNAALRQAGIKELTSVKTVNP